jgi:general stress protein CsbA
MSETRPSAVTTAYWLLVLGAVLLMAGGLITATLGFETVRRTQPASVTDESVNALLWLNRGIGMLFMLSAVALGWLARRALRRDPRFRRAAVALALAIVLVVAIASVFGGFVLAPLALVPIIVGTVLLSRPAVVEWYAGE